jgi:TonB family protein
MRRRHASDGVRVIANPSVKSETISAEELKKVYLEERNSLSDGSHVEPVLEKDGAVHEVFLHTYLGGTDEDLQNYYRALIFSGKGSMPKQLGSDAAVVEYVSRTRGAIGYVSLSTETNGLKILEVETAQADRKLITRVAPEYPETLKRLKIGGTVRLRVTISPKGNVETVDVLGGNPILGEAAQAAVKQWVYIAGHSETVLVVSVPFDPER